MLSGSPCVLERRFWLLLLGMLFGLLWSGIVSNQPVLWQVDCWSLGTIWGVHSQAIIFTIQLVRLICLKLAAFLASFPLLRMRHIIHYCLSPYLRKLPLIPVVVVNLKEFSIDECPRWISILFVITSGPGDSLVFSFLSDVLRSCSVRRWFILRDVSLSGFLSLCSLRASRCCFLLSLLTSFYLWAKKCRLSTNQHFMILPHLNFICFTYLLPLFRWIKGSIKKDV